MATVLSERSEFSVASIFWFVFVAMDKNEQMPRVNYYLGLIEVCVVEQSEPQYKNSR